MARIRNIKPDYFRHEHLQDLEAAHSGCYVMLTYIALWTMADKNGVFIWKPRVMRLDILPFLQYDLEKTLQILLENGYIQTFENKSVKYGHIPTFNTHQVLTDKEKNAPSKHPAPNRVSSGSNPEQTKHIPGETEIGNRKNEIGNEGESHAHAHEENFKNQKNEPPVDTKPEAIPPPHGGAGGSQSPDPYAHCLTQIRQWGRDDDGKWHTLLDYANSVGYDPAKYGPVNDEVQKFTAYWLDPKRHPDDRAAFQADPARFFQDKGRKWLLDAKNMNKPKKDNRQKYEPPPPHQRQPRQNGNATPTTVGDIAGKIITEIAQ